MYNKKTNTIHSKNISQRYAKSHMYSYKITQDNLCDFALLSGDYNPIHIDSIYAKHSFFGMQIVYGIYQVLFSLNHFFMHKQASICNTNTLRILKIRGDFHHALHIDTPFVLQFNKIDKIDNANNGGGGQTLLVCSIQSQRKIMSTIECILAPFESQKDTICCNPNTIALYDSGDKMKKNSIAISSQKSPHDVLSYNLQLPTSENISNTFDSAYKFSLHKQHSLHNKQQQNMYAEKLYYDKTLLEKLFAHCAKNLDSLSIATLLASTRIVGMKVPGLHSIYASFQFDFTNPLQDFQEGIVVDSHTQDSTIMANSPLSHVYYTYKKHAKLPCFLLDIHAPIQGKIKAFERPKLIDNQDSVTLYKTHKDILDTKPFLHQKALIIGASSGLGNAAAKLLSLGGATILATFYNHALQDKDGRDTWYKHVNTLAFDVIKPSKKSLILIRDFNPTHIYYFATPKILANPAILDTTILSLFVSYYIFGLERLLSFSNPKVVFTPSSSFVEECPLDFKEYHIAKAALEQYGKTLMQRGIQIYMPRLPKVATNQTLSLIPQDLPQPDSVLLPLFVNIAKELADTIK